MARPTKAHIDLKALKHNFLLAASLAPEGNCLAVVKANAYGHGVKEVAKYLDNFVPAFGVACIEEANELREIDILKPILLLEGVFTPDEIVEAAEKNYWIMVGSEQQASAVLTATLSKPVNVWLKVDSGMHRLGVAPEQVDAVYNALLDSPNVNNEIVVATHLACGDELGNDFTVRQIDFFKSAVDNLDAPQSIANSSGLLGWPDACAEWNRPGYMLYGNSPFLSAHEYADKLRPVMTLTSAVIALRDIAEGETVGYGATWSADRPSKIATVAIGYGDGYPRNAANGTPVIVNGQRVKLVGRVSMDMITVDVTDLPSVALGDEVVLWGPDLTANEVASWSNTIGYEVLTRMPLRTPRVYR